MLELLSRYRTFIEKFNIVTFNILSHVLMISKVKMDALQFQIFFKIILRNVLNMQVTVVYRPLEL